MSIRHPSFRRNLVTSLAFATVFATLPIALASTAASDPNTLLWSPGSATGQWKAIGAGVLDSHRLPNDPGLRIAVDWDRATFGVAAVYQTEETTGAPLLPSLQGRIVLEARLIPDGDGSPASWGMAPPVEPVVEWVAKSGDQPEKAVRIAATRSEPGEDGWVRYEFETASQTAKLSPILEAINTLRIVFPKEQQSGRARVELRLVELKGDQ